MRLALLVWAFALGSFTACPQNTGPQPESSFEAVVKTNMVRARGTFKRVGGQLYNTDYSTAWRIINGRVEEGFTNSAIIKMEVDPESVGYKPVVRNGFVVLDVTDDGCRIAPLTPELEAQYDHDVFVEKLAGYSKRKYQGPIYVKKLPTDYTDGFVTIPRYELFTKDQRDSGPRVQLTNYTAKIVPGSQVYAKALETGTFDHRGDVLRVWDCGEFVGEVVTIPVLSTNFVPRAVK
jgi:hypothetical protein